MGCILPLSANLDFARHGIPIIQTYFSYHHTSCIDQIFMPILLPSTQYQVEPPQPPQKQIILKVKDGLVLPDKASLYLTAIEDADYKDEKIEFWNSVYGFDMSCIRKQTIMEPLVNNADQKQIVTNCQILKTMDIFKMASGDASFTVPFKLVAEHDDYIHALEAFFAVSFTKCHKLTGFSTGPRSRGTHWKQTVFYLEDVLTICQGEAVVGSMAVTSNNKNPRDLDIMLKYSVNGRRCSVSRSGCYRMR